MTKTAFITIAGKPNVGKSTLLNALVGEKVAIISRKPQTTRNRITGVITKGENQYVFIDTPGLHKPHTLLGEYMMKAAGNAIGEGDVVLFVIEAGEKLVKAETDALDSFKANGTRTILIINKVDRVNKNTLIKQISEIDALYQFDAVIPLSAKTGDGVNIIFDELEPFMAESPFFFPTDISTLQPERQLMAEIIREKALRLLDNEIPHGIAVMVEEFNEKKNVISVRAEIFCERENHKRIIIGKDGCMLKKIGTYARTDAEELFGIPVYLDLWVKVKENWRDRPTQISNFGYNGEDNKE